MDPTLQTNERLLVLEAHKVNHSDIVVVKHPKIKNKTIIKRVIGVPGDHISLKNNVLKINRKIIKEDYLNKYLGLFIEDGLQKGYSYNAWYQVVASNSKNFTNQDFKVFVPESHYFLLGDNRLISEDSRMFRNIESKQIIGKSIVRIWPIKIGSRQS